MTKIKLKSRLSPKKAPKNPNPTAPQEPVRPTSGQYKEFVDQLRANPNGKAAVLREWWEQIYKEFPNWQEHSFTMLELKMSYELIRQDYTNQKIPIPTHIQNNIEASAEYNLDKISPNLQVVIRINCENEERELTKRNLKRGEAEMKSTKKQLKAKKTAAKKSARIQKKHTTKVKIKKETVAQTIMRVLAENEKTKQNDTKLAKIFNEVHSDKRKTTESHIRTYRQKYNRGRDWGMNGVPKVLSSNWSESATPKKSTNVKVKVKVKTASTKKIVLKRKKRA